MTLGERLPTPRAEAAGDWCRRIAEGSLSPDEVAAFEDWMAVDPENRAAFDRASFIWRALDGRAAPPELVAIRMDALSALSGQDQPVDAAAQRSRFRFARGRAAALAGLAAVFVAVLAFTLLQLGTGPDNVEYATKRGERRVVMLDDGSRLSLDASSEVEVAYRDDRRDLVLRSGRAKFDVAKDPLKPFTVAAAGKLVVATGTSFSVEILRDQLNVVLYEGHVTVLDREPRRSAVVPAARQSADVVLRPGQELSVPTIGAPRFEAIDPARAMSWEGGQLSFADEPLGDAVQRMNRYSSIELAVKDPVAARVRISGVFNAEDTEGFVTGVSGVFPVRPIRRGDTIEFVRKP